MMQNRLFMAVMSGWLAVASTGSTQDPQPLDKFDGKWQITAQTTDGKMMSEEELKNRYLVFRGDKVTQLFMDNERGNAATKIDATKNPKEIEFHYLDGPAKGVVLKGIYSLDGDSFTICLSGIDRDRPKAFESKEGSGTILLKLKRVK